MADAIFGHVPGSPVGRHFATRREVYEAGLHRNTQAGIAYSAEGAESIVLSGGYEDDWDEGDTIVYTGAGGRDQASGRQVADQELVRGNLALARNAAGGLPVRVIRGAHAGDRHGPPIGYRYDGLYRVADYWQAPGRSGHLVWRYRLERLPEEEQGEVGAAAGDPRAIGEGPDHHPIAQH